MRLGSIRYRWLARHRAAVDPAVHGKRIAGAVRVLTVDPAHAITARERGVVASAHVSTRQVACGVRRAGDRGGVAGVVASALHFAVEPFRAGDRGVLAVCHLTVDLAVSRHTLGAWGGAPGACHGPALAAYEAALPVAALPVGALPAALPVAALPAARRGATMAADRCGAAATCICTSATRTAIGEPGELEISQPRSLHARAHRTRADQVDRCLPHRLRAYQVPSPALSANSSSGAYTRRCRPHSAKYTIPSPNHTAAPSTPKR